MISLADCKVSSLRIGGWRVNSLSPLAYNGNAWMAIEDRACVLWFLVGGGRVMWGEIVCTDLNLQTVARSLSRDSAPR